MAIGDLLIDAVLGLTIGLTLGLLGGGGSILTVPALVYIVGQSPQIAVTASLVIVGINSVSGIVFHRAQGTLDGRVALLFGGAGMIAAYLAAGWSSAVSPGVLMILFALLMLIVGIIMIVRPRPAEELAKPRSLQVILISGLVVGAMTGFLGVGGGFLIVPALVLLVGLPMRQAVGTSLIVIAMNSLAGFLGHLGSLSLDFGVIGLFVGFGMIGTFLGARLAKRVDANILRRLFAIFVIGLAIVLLFDNVRQLV